jgi:hypothetical protein
VVGASYRVTGWACGYGVNGSPRVSDNVATIWSGTTSNLWQYFDATFVAQDDWFTLHVVGNAATEDYAEFDDVSVVPVDNPLYQATAAIQPAVEPAGTAWNYASILYNGVDEYSTADAAAAPFSGVDKPTHVVFAVQHVVRAAGKYVWMMGESGSNVHWYGQYDDGTNLDTRREDDGGVNKTVDGGAAMSTNAFIQSQMFDGQDVNTFYNSVADVSAGDLDVGTCTHNTFTLGCLRRAANSGFANVRYGQFLIGTDLRNRPGLERWVYRKYPWS